MNNQEAIEIIRTIDKAYRTFTKTEIQALEIAIKALKQESSGDLISRADAEALFRNARSKLNPSDYKTADEFNTRDLMLLNAEQFIHLLPSVNSQPKTGHCKNCKWWKDSDGVYRRGSHAESQCPINRREVMEGMGYCFMFEQQERIDQYGMTEQKK